MELYSGEYFSKIYQLQSLALLKVAYEFCQEQQIPFKPPIGWSLEYDMEQCTGFSPFTFFVRILEDTFGITTDGEYSVGYKNVDEEKITEVFKRVGVEENYYESIMVFTLPLEVEDQFHENVGVFQNYFFDDDTDIIMSGRFLAVCIQCFEGEPVGALECILHAIKGANKHALGVSNTI